MGRPAGSKDKRPRPKRRGSTARRAARKATVLKQLDDTGLQEACRATTRDVKALDQIIAGGPKARNAQSRVKAVEVKWAYGHGRPSQRLEIRVGQALIEFATLVIEAIDQSVHDPDDRERVRAKLDQLLRKNAPDAGAYDQDQRTDAHDAR